MIMRIIDFFMQSTIEGATYLQAILLCLLLTSVFYLLIAKTTKDVKNLLISEFLKD